MPASYYRLLVAFAASLSLLLGGCTATRIAQPDATVAELPKPEQQEASALPEGTMDTESTIWTLLGIAKKPQHAVGPETGPGVSPVLWQATLDTLNFVDMDSLDPMAGVAKTKWYSPQGKQDAGAALRFAHLEHRAPDPLGERSVARCDDRHRCRRQPRKRYPRTGAADPHRPHPRAATIKGTAGPTRRRGIGHVTLQFPGKRDEVAAALARAPQLRGPARPGGAGILCPRK